MFPKKIQLILHQIINKHSNIQASKRLLCADSTPINLTLSRLFRDQYFERFASGECNLRSHSRFPASLNDCSIKEIENVSEQIVPSALMKKELFF